MVGNGHDEGRAWNDEAGRPFNPSPAVTTREFAELVLRKGRSADCAITAAIRWTFLLSVPSECLPLHRRRAGEDLRSDDRQDRTAGGGLVEGKTRQDRTAGGNPKTEPRGTREPHMRGMPLRFLGITHSFALSVRA